MSTWAVDNFGATLVTKEGNKPTTEVLANKKRVALYFSAHWVISFVMMSSGSFKTVFSFQCPPCRGFTPVLAEFYEQLKEENESELEIIFVSSDNDLHSFQEYYGSMPWTSIPYTETSKIQKLGEKFSVRGIPHLVVLNPEDGTVKDADGRSTVSGAKGNTAKAVSKWA